jgi:hypothetical protein
MNMPVRPPSLAAPPELKEVRVKDAAGRVITSFEGKHPSVWMHQFSCNPRRVTMIKTR